MTETLPTASDLEAAALRIEGVARRTSVERSRRLDERAGMPVALKLESLQRSGAFKFRGAYNAVSVLPDQCRGVVTYSSGNHAGALSLAARISGRSSVVVMPEDAPQAKVSAAAGYGARIVRFDRFREDRVAIAAEIASELDFAIVPPFDHPDIILGQASVGSELLDQIPGLDVLVVPVGGGGLLAGCALAARNSGVRVIGVEPQLADDFKRSMESGSPVEIPQSETIADGLRSSRPGELTFSIARDLVDEIVTVTEDAIREAMRFLFESAKLVVEPSGAVGVAAVMTERVTGVHRAAGVIVSGGNVGIEQFCSIVGSGQSVDDPRTAWESR